MSTAYERVQAARSKDRPVGTDYIENIFTDFFELHGDRRFSDDPAIVGGVAMLKDLPVTVIAMQKGKDTKERIMRNFGAPNPEGFGSLMDCLQLASHSRTATDVSEDQLKNVYKWNADMISMKNSIIELCDQNPVFEFGGGVSNEVTAMTDELKYATMNGSKTRKWDSVIEEYDEKLNFEIKKANSQIELK